MTNDKIKSLIRKLMDRAQVGEGDYVEAPSCCADIYIGLSDLEFALHSVEAEKEPVAITTDHFEVVKPGHIEQTIRVMGDSGLDDGLKLYAAPMEAEKVPEWISVDKQLPEEAQEVLFVRGNKVIFGAWVGGIFWSNNQKQAALYWMPLPAPPEHKPE